MKIEYSRRFIKHYRRLRTAEQRRFQACLAAWQQDPTQPSLRVHRVHGQYTGFYSFNVGGDLRALYKVIDDKTVIFDLIGTHSQLYGQIEGV